MQLLTIQVARGIAANLVVLAHLYPMAQKYTGGHLPAWSLYGIAGVDVFFVLSGFIMVAVAGRNTNAATFLSRRAIRIYPTYWMVSLVVLAVAMAFPGMVNAAAGTETSIWKSFLLVPQAGLPLLAVGWTLIHEMYFYLVFALIIALRIPVGIGLAGWLLIIGLGQLFTPNDIIAASPVLKLVLNPLTIEFMLGAVAGLAYLHVPMRGAVLAALAAIGIVAVSIDLSSDARPIVEMANLEFIRVVMFGLPAALGIYALAAWEKHGTPHMPALLVSIGDWSYATYLVHVLALSAMGRVIAVTLPAGPATTLLFVILGLVLANVAGGIMTRGIEQPLLARIAHWRGRKQAPPEVEEAQHDLLVPVRS